MATERQRGNRTLRPAPSPSNVLAHRFVCRATVEEKIDQLIESKQHLPRELLDGGAGRAETRPRRRRRQRPN
jgi:non-specific serine/threonine protein kinase